MSADPIAKHPSVSIVVPARNEHGTIEKIVQSMPSFRGPAELIFIEGHSDDGTLDEIKRVASSGIGGMPIRYAVQEGIGKADAVWKGFDIATNDILIIYDADMTVPPEDIVKFYEAVAHAGGVVANGSRLIYPMESGAMRLFNYVGNLFFAGLLSLLCGHRFTDTLCGTKAIRRTDYVRLRDLHFIKEIKDPFGDFTLLIGAAMLGLKIVEIPVHYKRRWYGGTKIRRWSDGWKLLKIAIRTWLADRKTKHHYQ